MIWLRIMEVFVTVALILFFAYLVVAGVRGVIRPAQKPQEPSTEKSTPKTKKR